MLIEPALVSGTFLLSMNSNGLHAQVNRFVTVRWNLLSVCWRFLSGNRDSESS